MTEQSGDVQKPVGPFEDFEACVRHFDSDPEVDDPEALCGWMEENKDLAQEYDPNDGGILEFVESLKDPQAEKVLTNLSVTYVSGVGDPAIDSQWVYAKDADTDHDEADWGVTAPLLLKSAALATKEPEDEEQKAWAPVLIPNETDKQGDVIPADEIESAAHTFLAEYRKIDTDHDLFEGKGTPIESWTLKEAQTFTKPDGSESREYPAGTWMMGVQFSDEAWERVKEGELTGFSIYGEATQLDVEDFLSGDISPEEAKDASAATTAALAAKGVTGIEDEHMSEDTNEPDDQEKQVPPEGADLIAGSIESYIASADGNLSDSIEDWLTWAVEEGDFDVDSLSVAGEEFGGGGGSESETEEQPDEGGSPEDGGPETDGGEEPPTEDQQMSEKDNPEGGEESPAETEEQDDEPTLKDIHETVKETNDTVKSVQDRVDDLEDEVFGTDEDGGESAAEDTETEPEPDPTEDLDVEAEAEKAVKSLFGLDDEDLPDDPDERAEVIRKHVHENTEEADGAANPDEWNDDDFAALTGGD